MNGMKKKSLRLKHAAQFAANGLPRDPRFWTVDDWRDLHRAMKTVIKKVGKRHREKAGAT